MLEYLWSVQFNKAEAAIAIRSKLIGSYVSRHFLCSAANTYARFFYSDPSMYGAVVPKAINRLEACLRYQDGYTLNGYAKALKAKLSVRQRLLFIKDLLNDIEHIPANDAQLFKKQVHSIAKTMLGKHYKPEQLFNTAKEKNNVSQHHL